MATAEILLWKFALVRAHFFTAVAYFEIPLEFADDVNDFGKLLVLSNLAHNFCSNLYSTLIRNNVLSSLLRQQLVGICKAIIIS